MTAIQKNRKKYNEENAGFNDETLKQSGNEIEIVQKVEILMGGTPDPTGTGAYKSTAVSYNKTTYVLTLSSSAEASKFKVGDEVVLYSSNDNKVSKVKNCVKAVSGATVTLYIATPDFSGDIIIEKNLIFRVSNKNCYRIDAYGIKRFYSATAGVAEVETSMGEMFEYKWNRSDYSFTVDNYDGRFNPYMPGGENYTTFALREVYVYFGFGIEKDKNKLAFAGWTNLNNGISEEDEKLSITAYDTSYYYNIPVSTNKFSNTILNEDMRGKPIPVLFGDYTSYGRFIGSSTKPIVPATLYQMITTTFKSKLVIPKASLGVSKSLVIEALNTGETYDGYQIEVLYSTEAQDPSFAPSCVQTALGGGKYKYTVTLYYGKRSNGTLFSSTLWIANCLMSNSDFLSKFRIFDATYDQILEYKNSIQLVNSETGYMTTRFLSPTMGGASVYKAYYKICSNGIGTTTTNYKVWFNSGSYDDQAKWETTWNMIAGVASPSVTWDTANGQVIVQLPSGFDTTTINNYKAYVFVKGQDINSVINTDSNLLLNIGNNDFDAYTQQNINFPDKDKSGNGAVGKWVGANRRSEDSGFPLGGAMTVVPFIEKYVPAVPKICDTQWLITRCHGGAAAYYKEDYTALLYSIKKTNVGSNNFIWEQEFRRKDTTLTNDFGSIRHLNYSDPVLASFGFFNGSTYTPSIKISLDFYANQFIVSYNGNVTRTSTQISFEKVYGVKVVKSGSLIRIYLKNITDGVAYTECAYSIQENITGIGDINYILLGNSSTKPSYTSGGFYGQIGMCRFRMNNTSFVYNNFTVYGVAQDSTDVVAMARSLLRMGGATDDLFDTSWDNYYKSKVTQQYNARVYIADTDAKTVDYAVEMLGEVGLVLTMREDNGKMKFSLIWDNLDYYKLSDKRITSYDIEFGSVSIDRELNQYFNTANAKFNYSPAEDTLIAQTNDYIEPAAVERDADLNIWFNRDDKGQGSFEYNCLYVPDDVYQALQYKIANSTPNSEMITLKLSWRFLDIKIGDFVKLNYKRYVDVPCQVRSVKIDANGSSVEVKLRSLESVNFIDSTKGITYTPVNFDGIGGIQAIAHLIVRTDGGDV